MALGLIAQNGTRLPTYFMPVEQGDILQSKAQKDDDAPPIEEEHPQTEGAEENTKEPEPEQVEHFTPSADDVVDNVPEDTTPR